MDTPGKSLHLPALLRARRASSPCDNPLSSRFDENDAVLVFDEAFIPWENVLVYRDVEKATGFYAASGFINRYNAAGRARASRSSSTSCCGLIARALEANGTADFRGVQAQLGELMGWRSLMWAMTTALALDPQDGPGRDGDPEARVRRRRAPVRGNGLAQGGGGRRARPWAAARSWCRPATATSRARSCAR